MADIEYRFGTGQGGPTTHHSRADVDVDGDGVADGVALDFDGDGRVDDVLWDSDGDGVADTAVLDLDDDGAAESEYADPTGMGTWDEEGRDSGPDAPAQSRPEPAPAPHDADVAPEQGVDYAPYDGGGEDADETGGDGTGGQNGRDEPAAADDTEDGLADGSSLFDHLEDAPDVDRDVLAGWYDDLA